MSTNYPTNNDPDAIRADIERTRENLSRDVNALGESVSPGQVAHRQAEKVKGSAAALRERVMGTATDAGDRTSGLAHGVGEAASDAGSTVQRKARGNPLAAGVIALGAGWLLGSLLPASEKERRLSETVKEKAEPVVQQAQAVAKDVASESAEHLKQPAQDAVQSVKETAQSAAQDVKDEGAHAAADVRESASESADAVKNQPQG
jgi:ElaB/YqjD/DUF883 family membrane-anchored ribosome-binding protein